MTGLTIPQGGTDAGRAARPQFQPSGAGDVMAEFGQRMAKAGIAMENDRLSREAARLQVDLTRDMNRLRLEFEQIGDPDRIDTEWPQRVQQLRDRYFNGQTEDGRPRLDPNERHRERFGLAFDELAERHGFSLAGQALAGRYAQRQATWLDYQHEAVQAGQNADDTIREALVAQGIDQINAMIATGQIDAAEGKRRELALKADISNAGAIGAIADDPQGFLDAADAGFYGDLDGEMLARYRVQAQADLDRSAAAALKDAERQVALRDKEIAGQLTEMRGIFKAGRKPVDLAWLDTPEVKAHPDYAETMAALALQSEQPRLGQMTLDELDALIAAEAQKPLSRQYQAERLNVLRATRAELAEGWRKDPVAFGAEVGLAAPALPDFDPDDPRPYMQAVQARQAHGAWLVAEGHTDQVAIYSEAERDALATRFGAAGDPRDRLVYAQAMAATLNDQAATAARAATGDDMLGYATGLLAQGAPPAIAQDILSGQRRLQDKTVTMPSRPEFIAAFDTATKNEFRGQMSLAPQLIEATRALYAEAGGDPDTIDSAVFQTALQRALGATRDTDGDYTIGGLQSFDVRATWGGAGDDYSVPLPPGIPKKSVDRALDQIAAGLAEGADLSRLAAISMTGAAPDLGDPADPDYNPAEKFAHLRLAAIWKDGRPTDHYTFYRAFKGQNAYLYDENGAVFQFSLADLLSGGRR